MVLASSERDSPLEEFLEDEAGAEFEAFDEFPADTESEWEEERGRRRASGRVRKGRARALRSRRPRTRQSRTPRWGARVREPSPRVCPAHGEDFVSCVQKSLNQALGLDLPVTGVMDPRTRRALRKFQAQQGLVPDGIAGPETERRLIAVRTQEPAGTKSTPARPPELTETKELGELESELDRTSPEYVAWFQEWLNKLLGLRLAVDGINGPQTRSAVRSFQSRYGLSVDGIVGPQTEAKMISLGAANPPGYSSPSYPAPSPSPPPAAGTNTRAELAAQILRLSGIELWRYSPTGGRSSDGADALSNIRDTAAGRAAKRSDYGNAPGGSVYLDTRLLNGILGLGSDFDIIVTSLAGGSHSSTSRHYAGIAGDVGAINGVGVSASNPYVSEFMQQCRALGATEVLGPGSSGHDTHVHFAWPRTASEGDQELDAFVDDDADFDSETFAQLFENSADIAAPWDEEHGQRRRSGRGRRARSSRLSQPVGRGRPSSMSRRGTGGPAVIGESAAPCVCPAHRAEKIRWIQNSLNRTRGLQLKVSGVMDRPTRSALRAFQAERGLRADGIPGPKTIDALARASSRSDRKDGRNGPQPRHRPHTRRAD